MVGKSSGRDFDDLALAEKKLAESRGRMKDYRDLERSFVPGSDDRIRATMLVEEIESLQRVMDRLCRQMRHRLPGRS